MMSTTVPVRLSCVSLPRRRGVGGGKRAVATTARRPTLPVASKASSWRNKTYNRLVPTNVAPLSRRADDDDDMNIDVAVRASSASSSSAPSLESMCDPETYSGESNLWVTQELPRLLDTLPKKRPCDGLVLTRGSWTATTTDEPTTTLRLNGLMRFHNTTKGRFDMFVPEVHPRVTLISKRGLPKGVTATVRCIPRHEDDDPPARPDDYWAAYIVPVHGETTMEVEVEISSSSGGSRGAAAAVKEGLGELATLDAAFVRVEYVVYGHHGRTTQEQQVVLPLRFPAQVMEAEGAPPPEVTAATVAVDDDDDDADTSETTEKEEEVEEEEEEEEEEKESGGGAKGGLFGGGGGGGGFFKKKKNNNNNNNNEEELTAASAATAAAAAATTTNKLSWKEVKPGLSVLCVPTHLLCHMDDPVSVVRRYVQRHARPGDMVSIGETPLAVMQGRTRHPTGVRPGLIAKFVCKLFNRFSSIATACGMQCLVDVSGGLRVLLAAAVAVVARLFGKRGVFYKLAGSQANLIDDVSGTLPPYDQFITLGPVKVRETVDAVRSRLGLPCAVVDVNDLTAIKGKFLVLAKSEGVDEDILRMALLRNPAGNADQQTPLVLIRHDPTRRSELLAAAAADEKARKERARKGVAFVQK